MNGLSIIIPSRTLSNLDACVMAIRESGENARVIVVDDFDVVAFGITVLSATKRIHAEGIESIKGEKPFIFARNMNRGIEHADRDDVLLLNDDALLKTLGGFSLLQKAAEENPGYGLIASTTNCVGNTNQYQKGIGLREDPRMVCFVAVLIPRRTIDAVGLLDEEFTGYGFDDDSYCLRVRRAGLKIGIHDGCFVDHSSLPSTYRSAAYPRAAFRHNEEVFRRKYGAGNRDL